MVRWRTSRFRCVVDTVGVFRCHSVREPACAGEGRSGVPSSSNAWLGRRPNSFRGLQVGVSSVSFLFRPASRGFTDVCTSERFRWGRRTTFIVWSGCCSVPKYTHGLVHGYIVYGRGIRFDDLASRPHGRQFGFFESFFHSIGSPLGLNP